MPATGKLYGRATLSLFAGSITTAHPWKVMLVGAGYTPDQDAHQVKADVTNEYAGTGYTAGGATLTNVAVNYSAGTNTLTIDADDVAWNGTITARYAVVYDATTNALVGWVDFGAATSATGGTFTIEWNAAGIITATVAS